MIDSERLGPVAFNEIDLGNEAVAVVVARELKRSTSTDSPEGRLYFESLLWATSDC